MSLTHDAHAEYTGGVRPAVRHRRAALLPVAMVAGWLLHVALRIWLSTAHSVPMVAPDEEGYLLAGRVIAGGPGGELSSGTFYRGGYGLLFAPVYWFVHNPETVYRAVQVINALIGALIVPLGYVAARRLRLPRWPAWSASLVAGLLPTSVYYSQFALVDAIYPVLVLAWLLTVHGWLTAATRRAGYLYAGGAALLAVYARAVHSRGDVILLAFAVLIVVVAVRRRVPWRTLAAAVGTLAVALVLDHLLAAQISAVNYPGGARSLVDLLESRLTTGSGLLLVFAGAAGEIWRLCVDTWGIGAIGFAATLACGFGRGSRRDLRIMALLMIGVVLAVAAGSVGALPANEHRVSDHANGRYVGCLSPTFFLLGVAALIRSRGRRPLVYRLLGGAAIAAGSAVVVRLYAGARLHTDTFYPFNLGEPSVLTQTWDRLNLPLTTVVALGIATCCVAAVVVRPARPAAGITVMVLLAALSFTADVQITDRTVPSVAALSRGNLLDLTGQHGARPGDRVAVDRAVPWTVWLPQSYQVWWTRLELFGPHGPAPAGADVVERPWAAGKPAHASWPSAPSSWRVAVTDRADNWVLWRRAGHH